MSWNIDQCWKQVAAEWIHWLSFLLSFRPIKSPKSIPIIRCHHFKTGTSERGAGKFFGIVSTEVETHNITSFCSLVHVGVRILRNNSSYDFHDANESRRLSSIWSNAGSQHSQHNQLDTAGRLHGAHKQGRSPWGIQGSPEKFLDFGIWALSRLSGNLGLSLSIGKSVMLYHLHYGKAGNCS